MPCPEPGGIARSLLVARDLRLLCVRRGAVAAGAAPVGLVDCEGLELLQAALEKRLKPVDLEAEPLPQASALLRVLRDRVALRGAGGRGAELLQPLDGLERLELAKERAESEALEALSPARVVVERPAGALELPQTVPAFDVRRSRFGLLVAVCSHRGVARPQYRTRAGLAGQVPRG